MDREAVIEFLGHVPLLQRLPGSSLRRIADVVQVKHYDAGEYVVRSGESGGGVYFIWEGQAEVPGSVNGEDGNNPELQLGQYDYFGYGTGGCIHQVDVISLSKLTCLVLQHGNSNLLQPRSIWNADEMPENFSPVEHILHLEPLEVDLFRGITLPDTVSFGHVFGGQFIGQALAAASKTLDCFKLVHSLHAFFIVAGDINLPIIYQVQRPRDGKSLATRRVDATQCGTVVFTLLASFQKEESGFEHQEVLMRNVPAPETIPSMEELRERRLTDPRLPMSYRNTIARKKIVPWPIDIRFVETGNSTRQSQPSLSYWFKARGKLSDDPALHRCVVAYASDLLFGFSLDPHRQKKGLKTEPISLDHSYVSRSSISSNYSKEESGFEHQEVLMRNVPAPETIPSMEELRERRLTDPRLPMSYRNTIARKKIVPWPIDIRFVETGNSTRQSQPSLSYWFKARGKLSDDPALHRCVVAYASDLLFGFSLDPHRQKKGLKTEPISLDHSIWFHRPIKADDWLFYTMQSPSSFGGRGFVSGCMFNKKGELVASLTQEALIRKSKQQGPAPKPKL